MDGKGMALDNVFVERLWRDLKYEHVFLHECQNVVDLYKGLAQYFHFRNTERPNEALGYKIPWEVYCKSPINAPLRTQTNQQEIRSRGADSILLFVTNESFVYRLI